MLLNECEIETPTPPGATSLSAPEESPTLIDATATLEAKPISIVVEPFPGRELCADAEDKYILQVLNEKGFVLVQYGEEILLVKMRGRIAGLCLVGGKHFSEKHWYIPTNPKTGAAIIDAFDHRQPSISLTEGSWGSLRPLEPYKGGLIGITQIFEKALKASQDHEIPTLFEGNTPYAHRKQYGVGHGYFGR